MLLYVLPCTVVTLARPATRAANTASLQEGYSSIEYQIYTAPQTDVDTSTTGLDKETTPPWVEERHAILVELRRRGVLAQSAAVQKKICVFGGFQQAEAYMKELRLSLIHI